MSLIDSHVVGTDGLVARFPTRLLTFLGLYINTRAWEKEVQHWCLGITLLARFLDPLNEAKRLFNYLHISAFVFIWLRVIA